MKEQIEKLARDICHLNVSCDECTMLAKQMGQSKERYCKAMQYAKRAYEKGWRKQSEGEWIDKPTGAYSRMQSWCSACGKHSGIGGIESNRHKPYCPNCGSIMKGAGDEKSMD